MGADYGSSATSLMPQRSTRFTRLTQAEVWPLHSSSPQRGAQGGSQQSGSSFKQPIRHVSKQEQLDAQIQTRLETRIARQLARPAERQQLHTPIERRMLK